MKKISILTFIVIIIAGFFYVSSYTNQYSIEDEKTEIYASLLKWQNRASDVEFKMSILDMVQVDKSTSYIVLFETPAKNIGSAQLVKGWNGKFKIIQSGWGDNDVIYSDIKTNKGMYGILAGKNPGFEIDYITALTVNEVHEFTYSVNDAETFVRFQKLPANLKETFITDLTFYDKNGQAINPMRKEI